MKNILITTSAFPLSKEEGLNEFLLEYAVALSKENRVFVLAPLSKDSKKEEQWGNVQIFRHQQFPFFNVELAYGSGIVSNIRKNPLLIFSIPFYLLMQLRSMVRLVNKHNISIINTHWIIPQGLVGAFYKLAFQKKIKVLATAHGSDLLGLNSYIGNALKKFSLKNSDELSVVSEKLKEKATSLGFAKTPHVLPMGIDTDRFKPMIKNEVLVKKYNIQGPVLLFVGNCIEEKGLKFLLDASQELKSSYKNLQLLIVGNGIIKTEMEKKGVPDHVTFVGSVKNKDLPGYYSIADVFVLPSFSEGYSLVVREALSCEIPVVVTEIPAFTRDQKLKELLYFVHIKSSKNIVTTVKNILDNQPEVNKNKAVFREYVVGNASWEVIGKKYQQLISHM